MDAPIQKLILNKFEYEFITPSKDVLFGNYDELYAHTYGATIDNDLDQNI